MILSGCVDILRKYCLVHCPFSCGEFCEVNIFKSNMNKNGFLESTVTEAGK